MKKLSKLTLNELSEAYLRERGMNALIGGYYTNPCSCSCYWEGNGGSGTADNAESNAKYGYDSNQGCNQYVYKPGTGWDYCDSCTA